MSVVEFLTLYDWAVPLITFRFLHRLKQIPGSVAVVAYLSERDRRWQKIGGYDTLYLRQYNKIFVRLVIHFRKHD